MTSDPSVLLLHNSYREPGGEERSVGAIAALLRDRGHEVSQLERSSAPLVGMRGRARAGVALLRGGLDSGSIAEAVERSGAAIVHAHNLTPLLGPRALEAARERGARVVLHLHNYRLVCAIAITWRDGESCTRCHGRNTWPGVRLRCRGNLAEAAAYGAGLALHQPRTLAAADRILVPSRAAADRLGEIGLHDERVDVLPNFLPADDFARSSEAGKGEHALFAGRLTVEKGVDTAIAAASRSGVPLVIAGAGPDEARLRSLASGAPVRFAGRLSPTALAEIRRHAAFAVVPSRWHEPCPYAAIEAMAAGLPVLASDVGGLPEIVGNGALDPRAEDDWAHAMASLHADPGRRQSAGEAALARARELFGPERSYERLLETYARAAAA